MWGCRPWRPPYDSVMASRRLAILLAALAGHAFVAAQTTRVVSGGGNALQAAVLNAAAGDVLDVQPAIYSSVVCDKGVHIRLQPGAEIHVSPGGNTHAVEFTAVPATETAILSGGIVERLSVFHCDGAVIIDGVVYNPQPSLNLMHIQGCSGPVAFTDSLASQPGSSSRGVFVITDSAQVSFTRCWVPRLVVTNSNLTASDTSLRTEGFGTEGMLIESGHVVWQGGLINGSFPFSFPIFQEAVRINGGEFVATGGTLIERSFLFPTSPDPSIEINGGTVRLDPSVTVTGSPAIVGPAAATITAIPSLSATHTASTLHVDIASQPTDAVFTFAGLPRPPYATPWGTAWLLPTDPLLNATVIGASGTSTFPYTFGPVPQHFVLTVQPIALSATGALSIGAPQRFAWN